MSRALYACVHAAEFPAQALLRLHTELRSAPVAVLEGKAPLQTVCSTNKAARMAGAVNGMTKLEAESIPGLRLAQRSLESEAAASAVLMECAANFSPRIEDTSPHAYPGTNCAGTNCACVLDITGTERLFGPPEMLAARLRAALAEAGFRASIAVSANFHTARLKAAASPGITVIPAGEEAQALNKLPLAALGLHRGWGENDAETFAIWGIRTLGELAALPEVELVTRIGERVLEVHALARGALPHAFQPMEPKFELKEFCEFETPVEQADSLLFVAARMIDCLVARAGARAMSLAALTVRMALERGRVSGRVHERVIRPALASADRKFLLKLMQLELAAHPPQAAVVALTMTAQAGQSSKVQLGLFAPQMPEPSRLDVTLARLKAIAGEDRVGSPVLEDTHRPGAFRIAEFAVGSALSETEAGRPRMALRRMRPPVPVRVVVRELRPVAFRDRERTFEVEAAYGPWRTSGCWWSEDNWDAEEWDVLALAGGASTMACLLVRDCGRDQWRLEALYD